MRRIYYLSSCSTCKRILGELGSLEAFELIDIKANNIDSETLDRISKQIGTYEMLFSKRARKYQELNLAKKQLLEKDYRALILEEYTFLKRPVIIFDDHIFVGNDSKTLSLIKEKFAAL